jgi:hypothetical protein
MNEDNVLNIVRKIEAVLVDEETIYPDSFAAALYVATVSANQMGMTKDAFLDNCGAMYDFDKREQLKEMQ